MNFEEMLNSQDGASVRREKLPFGCFYRKQIEKKYRYVIELKPDLTDSIVFCEALKNEHQWSTKQMARQQLHYELHTDSSGVYEMELETGNYQTLSQLLDSSPAVVAKRGFIDQFVASLIEFLGKLHSEGVYQLCLAPQNVFVRKGDNAPMLLCHGSFYTQLNNVGDLYGSFEDYVAPEVLAHEAADERSDVYSLGKMIEFLFSQSSMPYEYKQVVKKATHHDAAQRYKSVEDMKSALAQKRGTRQSVLTLAAVVVISLVCVFAYLELVPQATSVEFVNPGPQQVEVDPLDEPYDLELQVDDDDSLDISDADLQNKAAEIYRKRYLQKADEILSKVYSDERMNGTEKAFVANTQSLMEELSKLQKEMGEEAGISEEDAGRIGQEVVEQLTRDKEKNLTRKGYVREPSDDDEE